MVNKIIKIISGKDLVLYNRHRQSIPVVNNNINRKKYFFIEVSRFWRMIPYRSHNKRKYRIMFLLLNLLNPRFIIDINWISPYDSVYKLWTKKHTGSKFIVIQHGAYVGGIVTDIAHRYTKCDIFLTWGNYFTQMFKSYNQGKEIQIQSFGNPIYNDFNRQDFKYINIRTNKILLAPSAIKGSRLKALIILHRKLIQLGFDVSLKEHVFQTKFFEEITEIPKIHGNTFEILRQRKYDLILTDHSTLLLDAIFFKNKVLYFSGPGEIDEYQNNFFTSKLKNYYTELIDVNSKMDVYNKVDMKAQETLFENMIDPGNNVLNF